MILLCVATATGCFWRSYPQRLRTHSDLLVAFARKAQDLVASGRFAAENLPELTYPLERAVAFAADVHRRTNTPPPSLVAFEREIERYRAFVQQVDQGRHARDGAPDAHALDAPVGAIESAAAEVTAALECESTQGCVLGRGGPRE